MRAPQVKFETAFHTASIPMSIATRRAGRLLEVNDAFCDVSGYDRAELIGRSATALAILTTQDHETIVGALPEYGIVRDFEINFRRRDGILRRGLVSASPIEVEGEPCFLNATIDITDRWDAEQALRESEERFRTIFDSAADGILIVDETGRFLDANRAACERLGYTREEVLALSSDALATPEEATLNRDRLAFALERGPMRFDSVFVARDGTGIPTQIIATKMELKGRRTILIIGRDLTEFRRAEAERVAAERERARIARLAAAVSALDATLGVSADDTSVFHRTTRLLVSIGGLAMASVGLMEPAGGLRIHAVDGDEPHLQANVGAAEGSLRPATKAEADALQAGHAIVYSEGDTVAIGSTSSALEEVRTGGGAVFPIREGGFTVGIVAVTADEHGFFGEPEVQLLEQIVGLVAARLGDIARHAREVALTATLEAERRETERFVAMAATIDRSLNRISRSGALYLEACRLPVDLSVCALARFGLAEDRIGGSRLRFVASSARDKSLEDSVDALLGHTTPFTFRSEPPSPGSGALVVNDLLGYPRFRRRHQALREAGLRALVEVPVYRGPTLVGSMYFYAEDVGAFGMNEVALLDRLAADVGHRLAAIESERRHRLDEREIDRFLNRDTSNASVELGPKD
jgi:PAS domain S-box-containing protein